MTKKYSVKITATAQNDLESIWNYISQDSPQNAMAFIDEIEHKVIGLSEFPDRHPIIPESQTIQTNRYRHLLHKDYRVIYRREDDKVFVLRVFHGSKLLDLASM